MFRVRGRALDWRNLKLRNSFEGLHLGDSLASTERDDPVAQLPSDRWKFQEIEEGWALPSPSGNPLDRISGTFDLLRPDSTNTLSTGYCLLKPERWMKYLKDYSTGDVTLDLKARLGAPEQLSSVAKALQAMRALQQAEPPSNARLPDAIILSENNLSTESLQDMCALFKACPGLRSLDLSNNKPLFASAVDRASTNAIFDMFLPTCKFESRGLELDANHLDGPIHHAVGHPRLQRLILSRCNIGASFAATLATCLLEQLWLRQPGHTAAPACCAGPQTEASPGGVADMCSAGTNLPSRAKVSPSCDWSLSGSATVHTAPNDSGDFPEVAGPYSVAGFGLQELHLEDAEVDTAAFSTLLWGPTHELDWESSAACDAIDSRRPELVSPPWAAGRGLQLQQRMMALAGIRVLNLAGCLQAGKNTRGVACLIESSACLESLDISDIGAALMLAV
jgi:hypothetical protein